MIVIHILIIFSFLVFCVVRHFRLFLLNNFYCDILHLYNIVWFLHKFSNICKPEEGWYGQPKYCHEKAIHVVLGRGGGAHLPLSFIYAYPYSHFAECRLRCSLAQANLFAIFTVSIASVIELWQCISRQVFRQSFFVSRVNCQIYLCVFQHQNVGESPQIFVWGLQTPLPPPPAPPPIVTFPLIFKKRRRTFSSVDVASKSNSVLFRCSTVFFLTEKKPNTLLWALIKDVVKVKHFSCIKCQLHQKNLQHVYKSFSSLPKFVQVYFIKIKIYTIPQIAPASLKLRDFLICAYCAQLKDIMQALPIVLS